MEDNGVTVPVEVKPNRVAAAPRESDVMQLAAYALLIDEGEGRMTNHSHSSFVFGRRSSFPLQ